MITGIDHVVLLAAALEPAIRGFERAGFSVVRGGIHPAWGTENALISFADGSYLELLAPRDPSAAVHHRLWLRADGRARNPGEYGGFALDTNDLRADLQAAAALGLEFRAPERGSRRRTDGMEVKWLSATAHRPYLPFLIEDFTPRSMRVPGVTGSLNARTRLAAVTVAAADVAEAGSAYAALLGQTVVPIGTERMLETARGRIILTDLQHVPRHHGGPGPAAVSLAVAGADTPLDLTDVTGGAILTLVPPETAAGPERS